MRLFLVFYLALTSFSGRSYSILECLVFEATNSNDISKLGLVAKNRFNDKSFGNLDYSISEDTLKVNSFNIKTGEYKSLIGGELVGRVEKLARDKGLKNIDISIADNDFSYMKLLSERGYRASTKTAANKKILFKKSLEPQSYPDLTAEVFSDLYGLNKVEDGTGSEILLKSILSLRDPKEIRTKLEALKGISPKLMDRINDPSDSFSLSFLLSSLGKGDKRFKEAIEVFKNTELINEIDEVATASYVLNKEEFADVIFRTPKEKDLTKQVELSVEKYKATHKKQLKKFKKRYKSLMGYKEKLKIPLKDIGDKEELEKLIFELFDDYEIILPGGKNSNITLSLKKFLSKIDSSDYKLLKQQRPDLTLEEMVSEAVNFKPQRLGSAVDSPRPKWIDDVAAECLKRKSPLELKKCIQNLFRPAKEGVETAIAPLNRIIQKRFPCLASNRLLLADLLLNIGFYTYFTYSTFKDIGEERGAPKDRQWREIPYEYIGSMLLFTFRTGELACKAASAKKHSAPFGKEISLQSLQKTPSSWMKNTGALIKLKMLQVTALSAIELSFDRLLDRVKKRSVSEIATEFPGKLLYFSVWGSIKNVVVTKYVKNAMVPWLTKAVLPQTLKHNLITQLVVLTAIDKVGIGKLNMLDLKVVGEKMMFPIGEIIIAALVKKQSPEVLESLPEKEREFIEAASQALDEGLSELGLTTDDIEISKDENDPAEPIKFRISNDMIDQSIKKFKKIDSEY